MNIHNAYMDKLRKSKRIALGIVADAMEALDDIDIDYDDILDVGDLNAVPSTSKLKSKRSTEIVKYGKITFNTTAILHHYPQLNIVNESEKKLVKVATKKSDLNLPLEDNSENNNQIKGEVKDSTAEVRDSIAEVNKKDNFNNNATPETDKRTGLIKAEVLNESLKVTEEKLV